MHSLKGKTETVLYRKLESEIKRELASRFNKGRRYSRRRKELILAELESRGIDTRGLAGELKNIARKPPPRPSPAGLLDVGGGRVAPAFCSFDLPVLLDSLQQRVSYSFDNCFEVAMDFIVGEAQHRKAVCLHRFVSKLVLLYLRL